MTGIRVVIVDDQPLVRAGFRMVLGAQADMTVVGEAGDGAEALRLLRHTEADVVVMDIRMPVLDGVEATRRLCAEAGGPRVLVLTTFDTDEDAFAALQAGASAFLLKNDLTRSRGHYFYGVYYCSQAMFQLGDNYWNSYRAKLHEQLLPAQNANGSWTGRNSSDDVQFGPNYCTSMAVLALSVEYRLLPIYQRDEDSAEEKK